MNKKFQLRTQYFPALWRTSSNFNSRKSEKCEKYLTKKVSYWEKKKKTTEMSGKESKGKGEGKGSTGGAPSGQGAPKGNDKFGI